MRIDQEVINVLNEAEVSGNELRLTGQLDRKMYVKVNKVLESIGGKWNRKAKAHVFKDDVEDILAEIINTGEYTDKKKEYQFFPTPKALAQRMIDMCGVAPHHTVLEPSAGNGAIAKEIPSGNITVCEIMPENVEILKSMNYTVIDGDFLKVDGKWECIIANPPFTKQQDVDHIRHMYDCLTEDGVMVTICSESPFFRTNKKSVEFRKWLDEVGAEVEELEAGAFRESGTMVKTRIIRIAK